MVSVMSARVRFWSGPLPDDLRAPVASLLELALSGNPAERTRKARDLVSTNSCFALCVDDRPVAAAAGAGDGGGVWILTAIGVAVSHRGRGLGRRLLREVERTIDDDWIEAETDDDAVGFYRSCGFAVESLGEKYPGVERFRCRRANDAAPPRAAVGEPPSRPHPSRATVMRMADQPGASGGERARARKPVDKATKAAGDATKPPTRRTQKERAETRRAEILAAAAEVFSANGFRNGSLADIAARVGITHQGILHHFGSKEQLLVEVLRARDATTGHDYDPADRPKGADFLRHVLWTVEENANRSGMVAVYTVLSAESVTEAHPAQDWFRYRYRVLRDDLAGAFEDVAGPGPTISAEEFRRAATALIAVMDGLQVQWLLEPAAIDMSATVRATVDGFLTGWGRPHLSDS